MKNWLKKHDLLKIVLFVILVIFVLTWIIPAGSFSGSTYSGGTIYRLGLDDFFRAPYFAFNYYLLNILFFLVVGVFYGILAKTTGYKKLVANLTNLFKNKVNLFVVITTILFALYGSIAQELTPILVFAPLVITVCLHLGLGKVVGIATTFGATLVGLLGTTYGNYGGLYLQEALGLDVSVDIGLKFGILAIALTIYLVCLIMYAMKNKKSSTIKAEVNEDKFLVPEEKASKGASWPLVVIFVILFAFAILGYVDFAGSFGINVFNDFNTWIDSVKIGDVAILRSILGTSLTAIGTWDLFVITYIILIAAILVKFIYHVKFDTLLENAFTGAKKMLRPVLFIILAYSIVYLWYPVLVRYGGYIVPTIINWLENLVSGFNPLITSLSALVASIFHIENAFTGLTLGSFYAAMYTDVASLVNIIFTTINGLACLILPTSVILLTGLAYGDVSYKSWLKFIWKFILIMLIILLLIFVVAAYI